MRWIFFCVLALFLNVLWAVASWPAGLDGQARQDTPDRLGSTLQSFSQLQADQKNMILGVMGDSGLSDLSFANIAAWTIFGSIGFIAFFYGNKQKNIKALVIGVALMGYPVLFPHTVALYLVGTGLCALLYFWRD